jgi:hypothetical protein
VCVQTPKKVQKKKTAFNKNRRKKKPTTTNAADAKHQSKSFDQSTTTYRFNIVVGIVTGVALLRHVAALNLFDLARKVVDLDLGLCDRSAGELTSEANARRAMRECVCMCGRARAVQWRDRVVRGVWRACASLRRRSPFV